MRGDELALDYEAFYNKEAIKLIDWMCAEDNRTKQSKLYRTACRMEHRYRRHHGLPKDDGPCIMGGWVHFPISMRTCIAKARMSPPRPQN